MNFAWMSAKNFKWLVTALALPVMLLVVSSQFQSASSERQALETRLRLYTELLSKREEADTSVRRGIFDRVLETYLKSGGEDLQQKLVALELLALNFHDSLALSPLFWHFERQILREPTGRRDDFRKQLERIARTVKDRQIEVLEVVGAKRDATVDFEELSKGAVRLFDEQLSFEDPDRRGPTRRLSRRFHAEAIAQDSTQHRLLLRIQDGEKQWVFWSDQYDFPMVDFVRLSTSERYTLVLRTYRAGSAEVTFIYYPSARAGVKDKPFIDEVISDLGRR